MEGGRSGRTESKPSRWGVLSRTGLGCTMCMGTCGNGYRTAGTLTTPRCRRTERPGETGDCNRRVARGGSWYYTPKNLRSANRNRYATDYRDNNGGFRIARTITPETESQPAVLVEVAPQPFTVRSEPADVRVRIVNIEERYAAGMALGPGEYEVEVSAVGYEAVRETVRHGGEPTEHRIVLVEVAPQLELIPLIRVPPRYPERAARLQVEGSVTVEFTITTDGSVTAPVIINSDPPRVFDRAALQAIVQWKFKPRMENGQAVESRVAQRIEFAL